MKLRHKIAGTFVLPLALAIASTAATAAVVVDNDKHTLKIGGFVAATADWTIKDKAVGQDSDINFDMGLGTSRLNVTYTQKTSAGDISYIYENDFNGVSGTGGAVNTYRLRHAAIKYDGWVAGYTWSGFANAANLAETIDLVGTTGNSATAPRTAILGKDIKVADGMTVGLFVENSNHSYTAGGPPKRTANTPLPDVVANYKAKFGNTNVFAAVRMVQLDKATAPGADKKTEGKVDFSLAVNSQVTDALNLKLAMVSFDEGIKVSPDGRDLAVSVAGQYKITNQIRTNLVVEQFVADQDKSDYTAVWVNAFYKMDSGFEWGAEVRSVSADTTASVGNLKLSDKDMSFNLQAKYAF